MYSYICFGKIRLQRYEIETKASRFTYCGIRKKNKKKRFFVSEKWNQVSSDCFLISSDCFFVWVHSFFSAKNTNNNFLFYFPDSMTGIQFFSIFATYNKQKTSSYENELHKKHFDCFVSSDCLQMRFLAKYVSDRRFHIFSLLDAECLKSFHIWHECFCI